MLNILKKKNPYLYDQAKLVLGTKGIQAVFIFIVIIIELSVK